MGAHLHRTILLAYVLIVIFSILFFIGHFVLTFLVAQAMRSCVPFLYRVDCLH